MSRQTAACEGLYRGIEDDGGVVSAQTGYEMKVFVVILEPVDQNAAKDLDETGHLSYSRMAC